MTVVFPIPFLRGYNQNRSFGFFLPSTLFFLIAIVFSLSHGFCICDIDRLKVNSNVNVKSNLEVKKEVVSDDHLSLDVKDFNLKAEASTDGKNSAGRAQTFTFEEMAAATGNFRSDCFLGEGGFGKVYKGYLEKINQVGCESDLECYSALSNFQAGLTKPYILYNLFFF